MHKSTNTPYISDLVASLPQAHPLSTNTKHILSTGSMRMTSSRKSNCHRQLLLLVSGSSGMWNLPKRWFMPSHVGCHWMYFS